MSESAYIYLLQDGEYKGTNIYKIGKTVQKGGDSRKLARLQQYSIGTIVLHQTNVPIEKINDIEKIIILLFRCKYKLHRGNEWFEGNFKNMVKDINWIVDSINESLHIQNNTNKIILNNTHHDSNENHIIVDDHVMSMFPCYKDDIKFGGTKYLIHVTHVNDMIYVNYIEKLESEHDKIVKYSIGLKHLNQHRISQDNYYNIYIKNIIKYVIKPNSIYDLNDKLLGKLNKYKHKYTLPSSQDIIVKFKEVDFDSIENRINHYIFNNCILNNSLYCDIHNNLITIDFTIPSEIIKKEIPVQRKINFPVKYGDGYIYYSTKDIIQQDIVALCETLNDCDIYKGMCTFEPEPISEGGIIYKFLHDKEWYKSIRLCIDGNYTQGKWPWVNNNVMTEWKQNDIILEKGSYIMTHLESFNGAPRFTEYEVITINKIFHQFGLVTMYNI